MTFIVQSYFDTLLRYVLSVTFCGALVLKVMDRLEDSRQALYNCVYTSKHLESVPDMSSQIFDWKDTLVVPRLG